MSSYDFYADMYAMHSEIGYLLTLGLVLLAFDGGLALMIGRWPRADVYLVPGVEAYGEVPVIWGRQPPVPAPGDGGRAPALIQVSLPDAGPSHGADAAAPGVREDGTAVDAGSGR